MLMHMFRVVQLFRVSVIAVTALLLVVQPAAAARWPEHYGGPEYLGGKNVTIRVHYSATAAPREGDWTQWPAVGVFLNNMQTYDGPMDYGSCAKDDPDSRPTANTYCGTPPSYDDRLIDKYPVEGTTFVKDTVVEATSLFHFFSYGDKQYYDLVKLSIVFYNDYWNPGANLDRNLAIRKVEFIGPDNAVFKTYTPQAISYYGNGAERSSFDEQQSFYFDMGIVTFDDQSVPTKMEAAFDKEELRTVREDSSAQNNEWRLGQEGSFNIVSADLYDAFAARYIKSPEPVRDYRCGMTQTARCLNSTTVQLDYEFSREPNFDFTTAYVRINARAGENECKNKTGTPIDWFCGVAEGDGLDQFVQLAKGTRSQTLTVAPGVEYAIRTSIDVTKSGEKVNDGGTNVEDLTLNCSSAVTTVTCQPSRHGPEDVNEDGVVDWQDLVVLVSVYGDRTAPKYLSADIDTDGYVSIFDYNRLLQVIKDAQ